MNDERAGAMRNRLLNRGQHLFVGKVDCDHIGGLGQRRKTWPAFSSHHLGSMRIYQKDLACIAEGVVGLQKATCKAHTALAAARTHKRDSTRIGERFPPSTSYARCPVAARAEPGGPGVVLRKWLDHDARPPSCAAAPATRSMRTQSTCFVTASY